VTTILYCDQCGARLLEIKAKFCFSCGKALSPRAQSDAEADEKNPTEGLSRGLGQAVAAQPPSATPTTLPSTAPSGLLANGVAYFLVYMLLAAPTYVLPYFGSNSSVLNTLGAATGLGALPQFWFHLAALYLLVIVAWMRGAHIGKQWLAVFPALAGIFDLIPGFSAIPMLPTLFHVLGTL